MLDLRTAYLANQRLADIDREVERNRFAREFVASRQRRFEFSSICSRLAQPVLDWKENLLGRIFTLTTWSRSDHTPHSTAA